MAGKESLFGRVDIVDLDDARHYALEQLISVQGTSRGTDGKKQTIERTFLRAFNIAPAGAYVTVVTQRMHNKTLHKWLESEGYVEGVDYSVHRITETYEGMPLPREGWYTAILRLSDPALRPPASAGEVLPPQRIRPFKVTNPPPIPRPRNPWNAK